MREILFRAKCGYNQEWVEGFYYQAKLCRSDKELCHYITIPHPECDGQPSDHIMVDPETLGQFTGLTDKNGKKIFEGDIVKHFFRDDVPSVFDVGKIFWDTQKCRWFRTSCKNYSSVEIWSSTAKKYEVIGNIHDNPELLEK